MTEKRDVWSEEARPIVKGEKAFGVFRSSHPQSRETRESLGFLDANRGVLY